MKSKVINAATCDVRDVTEESLTGFDRITINTAILITGERSWKLLSQYPVTVNAANVLEVPDGQNIVIESVNGKGEIGPDVDGTDTFLLVNGRLTLEDDSQDAVRSYYRIIVNGKLVMPKSYRGQFSNIQVNGKTEYYPDGSVILKPDTEIDSLFISRASNSLYYSSGTLYFLDAGMDTEKIIANDIKFSGHRFVIADGLVDRLIPQFDEETLVVRVPDGTRLINDDVDLKPRIIRKYGTKLCITGDVAIEDAEALESLEYLYADGTASVIKDLADALDEVDGAVSELKVIDPEMGYIDGRSSVKIGPAMIGRYPKGMRVDDCAKVILAEDLSPEDIIEKLHISGCALVQCTPEQEEAVHMSADDIAMIRVSEKQSDDTEENTMDDLFGNRKDAQVINAVEYKI